MCDRMGEALALPLAVCVALTASPHRSSLQTHRWSEPDTDELVHLVEEYYAGKLSIEEYGMGKWGPILKAGLKRDRFGAVDIPDTDEFYPARRNVRASPT